MDRWMAVHDVMTGEEWEAQQQKPKSDEQHDRWDSWSCTLPQAVHDGMEQK